MVRLDAIEKNIQIIKNCSESQVLFFLEETLNGSPILGLSEGETLQENLSNYHCSGILSLLTRGQLQNFLLDPNISLESKNALLSSEEKVYGIGKLNPFLPTDNEKVAELYKDKDYKEALNKYDDYMDYETEDFKDLIRAYDVVAENYFHEQGKVKIDGIEAEDFLSALDRIQWYEKENLHAILTEPNLAQRNKWLNEINQFGSMDDLTHYECTNMDKDSKRYFYYLLREGTARKFYRELGIDYDEVGPNPLLPENVDFGVEIEEIGVHYLDCEVEGFDSTYDTSIKDYDRNTGKSLETDTGEYITPVLSTESQKDYDSLVKQIDILNYFGAKTNESCGFHIHVSTPYTEDYVLLENKEDTDEEEQDEKTTIKAEQLQKEIYYMQNLLWKEFRVFDQREWACQPLEQEKYDKDQLNKYTVVNMSTLDEGTGIEFRFLNLPFALDKKVIDAYVDFVTNYILYIDEGNSTEELYEAGTEDVETWWWDWKDTQQLKVEILKQELCLKDDTLKVIEHLDDIYEFHNVSNVSNSFKDIDYYSKYDKSIKEMKEEEELETLEEIEEQEL